MITIPKIILIVCFMTMKWKNIVFIIKVVDIRKYRRKYEAKYIAINTSHI